jgi:hypothetical protein
MGFMCDFHSVRQKVNAWTEDKILVVRDDEHTFGENYFWPASSEALAKYAPSDGQDPAGKNEPIETEQERKKREEVKHRFSLFIPLNG